MKTKKLCHTLWLFFSIFIMFPLHASSKNTSTQFIVKEGKIPVPGGQVWYQIISTEKTNDNIPLLILHGGPGIPHDYLNVLKALANERSIIFYDQLGSGHSQIIKNKNNLWQLDRFERELEAVINTLHLKKVHLFGHSWGGALALQYALVLGP